MLVLTRTKDTAMPAERAYAATMAAKALTAEALTQELSVTVTELSNAATGAAWSEGPGEGCADGSAVDGAAVG